MPITMKFQDLGLSDALLRAVAEMGYETPTPIQEQAIPPVLQGRDLQGCAQTGTGKTAAFTLPILQLLSTEPPVKGRREIRALVLTPTRELAIQIDECCREYARHTSIRHGVIFGGVSQRPQVETLQRGVDLLVATPGRLLDLIGQGYITLDHIRFFVLDEADRMLDMGFIHDIRRILPLLPEHRQTLFFSATMPAEIAALAARILHDPVLVAVTPPASVVETIGQRVHFAEKSEKSALLIDLLRQSDAGQVLVFTRTKHGADRLARILNRAGIEAAAIHGNKSQNARVRAMNDFKSGASRVLIATDIAARGIDIDQLPLVINYDLPEVAETYVHRIGRTGRAGRDGQAWSFCSEAELEYLLDIQRLTGRTIPVEGETPAYAVEALAEAERKNARKAGRRSTPQPEIKTAAPQKEKRVRSAKKDGNPNPATEPGKPETPDTTEKTEKPQLAEKAELSGEEKAPKKRRRRRGRGTQQTATASAATAASATSVTSATSATSEPGAAVSGTQPATSGTGPAVTPPQPSHPRSKTPAAAQPAPQSQPAVESQPAVQSRPDAATAPNPGSKPRKRGRKANRTTTETVSVKSAGQGARASETKRDTPEASTRRKKARTDNTPRLEAEEYEPKTGIERARSRQMPARDPEQSEKQKQIPHTNDWKKRVKSLLLRSFRK